MDIEFWGKKKLKPELSTFRLTSSISSLRLSSWLGSRRKRALDTPSVGTTEESENFVRPEDIKDTLLPHSRWEPTCKISTSLWKQEKNNKQTKRIGLIFNYPLFISPQHWHQHPNQEVQKVSQFQETRLLAGHLHGARPGTPPPRTRQQIQDWERPHRQDQPTGIRTEASISSRAQGHTENGAGQAEARVEHHRLSSRQTRGSPQTDMSGPLQEENGNKSEGGEQSQGGHLCSVPKFSKCLRLLPNVLQHSFV